MEALVIVLAIMMASLTFALEAYTFYESQLAEAQGEWNAAWHERVMEEEDHG